MRCDFDKSKKIRFECVYLYGTWSTQYTHQHQHHLKSSNKCVCYSAVTYLCTTQYFLSLEPWFPHAMATKRIPLSQSYLNEKRDDEQYLEQILILDFDFNSVR